MANPTLPVPTSGPLSPDIEDRRNKMDNAFMGYMHHGEVNISQLWDAIKQEPWFAPKPVPLDTSFYNSKKDAYAQGIKKK